MQSVKRHGYKLLHRPDGVWQWKAGSRNVLIYTPDGERICVPSHVVAGIDDWERAKHKRYDQITPAMVGDWIDGTRQGANQ